jgi:hypothetical protein
VSKRSTVLTSQNKIASAGTSTQTGGRHTNRREDTDRRDDTNRGDDRNRTVNRSKRDSSNRRGYRRGDDRNKRHCPTTVIIKINLEVHVTLQRRVTNDFESNVFVPTCDMLVDAQLDPLINIIVETGVESGLKTHRH